ncbi:MAG: cytochrome b5 domain-containing protein [Candidatus Nomurabacteria bacterium]
MKIFYFATFILFVILGFGFYVKETYLPPVISNEVIPNPINVVDVSSSAPIAVESPVTPINETIVAKPLSISKEESNNEEENIKINPPSAPTLLSFVISSPTQLNLKWNKSFSNFSDVKYRVYKNRKELGTTINLYYADVDFSSTATYTYYVVAFDSNNNESTPSNLITVVSGKTNLAVTKPAATVVVTKPTVLPLVKPKSTPTQTTTSVTKPTPTPNPAPTPAPAPAPKAPSCGSGGSCTASDVSSHNTRANCWVYLSGPFTSKFTANKAYNITNYVANGSMHPGGDVIAALCGKNLYDYMVSGTGSGGVKHSSNAINSILQSYYIGSFN